MITKIIDENRVSVIPEDSDDLLTLRRIVKKGDTIIGDTTRVIKQDKEFARPDRGERVRIRIALGVEKISLDNVLDRIKFHGTITESNNDSVPHGSHHTFTVKLDEGFTIIKKGWSTIEKKILQKQQEKTGVLLVGIDTSDCGIGRLKGTHLQLYPNIYSGSSGKRYKTSFNIENFFQDLVQAVGAVIKKDDMIIIFGPGETRKKFANFLQNTPLQKDHKIKIVEGVDSSGEDGIYTFTKSQAMQDILKDNKLAKVSSIIDQIMYLANKKSRKFTMGFNEAQKANQYGAIESLVFSEKILELEDEEKIIEFLNDLEAKGVASYSVDSSTDLGLRVNSLGGIVSLLRFPID